GRMERGRLGRETPGREDGDPRLSEYLASLRIQGRNAALGSTGKGLPLARCQSFQFSRTISKSRTPSSPAISMTSGVGRNFSNTSHLLPLWRPIQSVLMYSSLI